MEYIATMTWTVFVKKAVVKQARSMPKKAKENLYSLMLEIQEAGPVRGNWPNYSKLASNRHHCHLKKGRPTYVAVWEEKEGSINIVEVIYAGTHEKAPY